MNNVDLALTFGFALSSNLDNVWVGMAYGLRRIRIPAGANLVIALVTGAGTLTAMLGGRTIGQLLTPEASDRWAGLLLLGMGGYGLVSGGPEDGDALLRALGQSEPPADSPAPSQRIGAADLALLTLALSINNLASGFAAGMTSLSAPLTTLLVMALSMLTLAGGLSIGRGLARWPRAGAVRVLSAGLLIALGFYEIFN